MNIDAMSTEAITGTNKPPMEVSPSVPVSVKNEKSHDKNKITGLHKIENRNADNNKNTKKNISSKVLKKITEDLNDYMDDLQTDLGFSIDKDENHQVIIQIKNRKTNKIIKQIPSKELLEIKKKMEELTGLIFDHKV